MKIRARITRKLIAPFNWHRDGQCRFRVLCMYDDLLIAEIEHGAGRARWRDAQHYRKVVDDWVVRKFTEP